MTDIHAIALAQINPVVGDLSGNAYKILYAWRVAEEQGAELLVFPELAICGYPPEDLILRAAFLDETEAQIEEIKKSSRDYNCAAILPCPLREGGATYNAAILIHKGAVIGTVRKQHLPNYGVFDEHRIFTPASPQAPLIFKERKLGVMICEDMWYPDVAEHLKQQGAEILIIPNASPFEMKKYETRLRHAKARAKETALPLVYVNQVGGQDELVFDGGSFVLDEKGIITKQMPFFEECLKFEDMSAMTYDDLATGRVKYEALYNALKLGLKDYVTKNGFSAGVLLGLSGGIDSAIVAALAADALGPDKVRAVMMPSRFTAAESLEDAEAIACNLGIPYEIIDIEKPLIAFEGTVPDLQGLAHENIQSRIRGTILMAISNASGKMLLSTGNKSEMACGYATLYGDMNGGYNPLKDVYKTDVFALTRWRNTQSPVIPERVITRPPTAELRDNQTDQDSLPPYEVLDDILRGLIEDTLSPADIAAKGHDAEIVNKVWKLLNLAEYKRRQAPPGPKITPRAFGRERRYPITNGFGKL